MQEQKKYIERKKVLAVLLLAVSVLVFQYSAKAETYLLAETGIHLYAGDSFVMSDYFSQEKLELVDTSSIAYAISSASNNKDCIKLEENGVVTAAKKGTAIVTVSYRLKEETKDTEDTENTAELKQENFTVTVLDPEKITASYGEVFWPKVFDYYNPYDTELDAGEQEKAKYTFSYSNESLALDAEKKGLHVQGLKDVSVYLERNEGQILVAEVAIKVPVLEVNKIARATKTDAFYPAIKNFASVGADTHPGKEGFTWTIQDKKIAAMTEKGICPVSVGKTKITIKLTAQNGDTKELSLQLQVTDPKVTGDPLVMAIGVTKKIPYTGTDTYSTYEYVGGSSSLSHVSPVDKKKLTGTSKGKETVKVLVDGRTVKVSVIVTDPKYNNYKFTMYKGLKKDFKLSGVNSTYSAITYKTSDSGIATVNKNGKVTAKKVGTAKLTATADGRKITVWIEISTKKGYQAATKGISISKTKTYYSQARRMDKGYYDCSSLISRVYREYKVYFGVKSGWSPVAADIGKWCNNNKMVISTKGLADTKLVPGDLIFYSYTKNGRYKNISHVEMYVGNGMDVSASSSNNKVIHYPYNKNSSIVMIARPTK